MREEIIYQNDSLKGKLPAENVINFRGTGELRIDRVAPLSFDSVPVRRSTKEGDTNAVSEIQKPTAAQLRYWWWQREKKLLVGDSLYIVPRNDVEIVASTGSDNIGLQLPSREIHRPETDWITVLLLLVLIVFASVKNSYSKYLAHLVRSIVNYPTSLRMFREKNYPAVHGAYRLDIFFYIIFPVFIFQAVNFFTATEHANGFRFFLWCFSVTTGFFIFKKAAYKFSGKLTECDVEVSEYLFNMDNINRVSGLILLPVVLINLFFPFQNRGWVLYLGIIILVFLYIKLLQRGILILFKKQFSIFYLFLYFCTLEFVPLVLLYNILRH